MGKNSNRRTNDVATTKLLKLELAVKDLMKNFNDTNIHGLVNCVMRGWIVDGRFTEEYLALTAQAQAEMESEQEQRRLAHEAELARTLVNQSGESLIIDTSQLARR
jgi:hypothetical protein